MHNPEGVQYSDLSPMAYAIEPELFGLRQMHVRVETQGEFARGFTVADLRKNSAAEPKRVCGDGGGRGCGDGVVGGFSE